MVLTIISIVLALWVGGALGFWILTSQIDHKWKFEDLLILFLYPIIWLIEKIMSIRK